MFRDIPGYPFAKKKIPGYPETSQDIFFQVGEKISREVAGYLFGKKIPLDVPGYHFTCLSQYKLV
jgi:hypothetical protein